MKYIAPYSSPLGPMTMASDGEKLTGLWFDGQKYDRRGLAADAQEAALEIFEETSKWLDLYFEGKEPPFTPPLKTDGSEFKQLVSELMLMIPYGKTVTYSDLAEQVAARLGKPAMSAQAVGGAVGHNTISIIVPCHRILGKDGSLTGYAGGTEKKAALLKLEGIDLK